MSVDRLSVLRSLVLVVVLCSVARSATGQAIELVATIEHIAGGDIYLSAGGDDGIVPGDTLSVLRAQRMLGSLVVMEVSSRRAMATFVEAPFSLTRGQQVRLIVSSHVAPIAADTSTAADDQEADRAEASGRSSILGLPQVASRRPDRRRRAPTVHGRMYADFSSTRSSVPLSTGDGVAESIDRSYSSPSVGLRLRVDHLPGAMTLNLNGRATYQQASGAQAIRSVRMYQASVSGHARHGRLTYEIGRFTSRYDVSSGYWDGAVMRIGGRGFGAGVSLGLEPDRYNQGFSTSMPKVAGFLNVNVASRRLRYGADVSVVSRRPTTDLLPHNYVAISQDFNVSAFRVSADAEVDHNPESDKLVASRLQLRATVPVQRHVSIFGRYSIRQPYAYWRTTDVISIRRDAVSTGFNVSVDGVSMSGSVTDNRTDGKSSGRGYSSSLRVGQSGAMPVGMSLSASVWQFSVSTSRHASAGINRSWGALRTAVTYTYYDSELLDGRVHSHLLGASATIPLLRNVSTSIQVRSQVGGYAQRTTIYSRLWMTL